MIIVKDSYLLELCRYVALNPVRAHSVENPEDRKRSSYRSTSGMEQSPPCLTPDRLPGQFSNNKKKVQKLYKIFIREGITSESPWKDLKGRIFPGDKRFIEKTKNNLIDTKEIPRSQRYSGRPELYERIPCHEDRHARDALISKAHIAYGYTMKEIADYLHLHYATVSRAVKRTGKRNA